MSTDNERTLRPTHKRLERILALLARLESDDDEIESLLSNASTALELVKDRLDGGK